MATRKKDPANRIAAENRKARYNYFIESNLEVGIMLEGSEVKSLREGKANIAESYATVEESELWLINSYIPPFSHAKSAAFSHNPRRRRKLLVHKRELAKLKQAIGREGMTLVPLKLYFNDKASPSWISGSPRARNKPTSARPTRNATGCVKRPG